MHEFKTDDRERHTLSFLFDKFFETLGAERYRTATPAVQVAGELGWEAPADASSLADRWVAELDRNHVSRAALIASVPGDEESVSPRFDATRRASSVLRDQPSGGRGGSNVLVVRFTISACAACVCLRRSIAIRWTTTASPRSSKQRARMGAAVFAHCGYLSIEARVRLGLPSVLDLRCGDPLALARTAARFPKVPVIIPHFGAGFFREALMAADAAPNIHFDTSSSNNWIKYFPGLTLTDVFRQALAVVGADRLIFGTDSSFFPRGWRRVIVGAQRTILSDLCAEPEAQDRIFRGNFDRLFPAV